MSHFDLHMTMILPEDISDRISLFMSGSRDFPFIGTDELTSILYLYGKNCDVLPHPDKVLAIAKNTVGKLEQSIEKYNKSPKSSFDSDFLRDKYIRRQLQITVDDNKNNEKHIPDTHNRRIINDPLILSECFSQHIAFYGQKYSFFFYGPLKDSELTHDLRNILSGRITMVGYNRKENELPFDHPILPLYVWARDNLVNHA